MGKTIAITNQKGGVGKTTTAINLTACLAEIGKKILLIDLDPQGNSTSGLGARAGSVTVYESLMGSSPLSAVIVKTVVPNLSLAPSDIRLAGAELELKDMPEREFRLKHVLQTVESNYDYIFIDCPPSLGLLTLNALAAAQRVLIPIQCEYYALEGVTSLMNTVNRVKHSFNPGLDIEGVLLTMLDGRTNLGLQVVDQVKKHFRGKVYSTAIPRNVRLGEAPSHGVPIHQYDSRSLGAESYRQLAREFLERNQ
ncbi:MAG TPA: ParA family protein [Candidatus Limiplasma sp.]|jgi:chromosome partitioning protein|nr:ParA family protein [Candidatus Limiplasma sp.]